jgi:hypothetical protein
MIAPFTIQKLVDPFWKRAAETQTLSDAQFRANLLSRAGSTVQIRDARGVVVASSTSKRSEAS